VSTLKTTNIQNISATSPAIVLAADGTATAKVSAINNGPLAGFRNAIINGNFDIWQRGTSFTGTEYGADRWINTVVGSSCTMSRQAFTPGQTDVPGEPTYFCRMAVTSVAGAGNIAILTQVVEDVRTFAGQQITVSFWAKADATKSIAIETTQNFGTGGSPSALVLGMGVTKVLVGTSWQKITFTTTVSSIGGKTIGSDGNSRLGFNIWFDAGSNFNFRTDTLGQQSGTFDIAQVQVEAGPVATPFERRPIGVELALCQRYYQHGVRTFVADGPPASTFSIAYEVPIRPIMRVAPTATVISSTNIGCTGSTHTVVNAGTLQHFATGLGNYISSVTSNLSAEL
jgi:hypothetical protein